MDSAVSFSVAAKHLFRHLHEPCALHRNPLVRRLFDEEAAAGFGCVPERAVLERIHHLVLRGAEYCRDADVASGKDERAHRLFAIVTLQCLEQRPIREVAAALGISHQHCYAERAEICRRVARYISEHDEGPALDYFPDLDEFQVLVDHAKHRASSGDMSMAFSECDELVRVAPSLTKKLEALQVSASVALRFGEFERAQDAHRSARSILAADEAVDSSQSRRLGEAWVDLIEFKLARARAETARAARFARRGATRLESIQNGAPANVRELYIECLYDLGVALVDLGDVEGGYDMIATAEAKLASVRHAASELRAGIGVGVWKLRNYLLMSARTWHPSWQRLKGLAGVFDQAYAAGLLWQATSALVVLTEYHASAGNGVEAMRAARSAVCLAARQGEKTRASRATEVAMLLLSTRLWMEAPSLLGGVAPSTGFDPYHRQIAAYFDAELALRRQRYGDAWALANVEAPQGYASLTVSRQLIAASAANELGHRRQAYTLVEAAIPAARGNAPLLMDAYRVAATVTGDMRYRRRANDLARLLTA